jgi:lysophospholipase L1-like esterase
MRQRAGLAVLLALAIGAAACAGGERSATTSPPAATAAGDAVYLSIGDSIQYGCCHDPKQSAGELFRAYLEQRLHRPVEWITVAGNDTADTFIHGVNGAVPQMQRAMDALAAFKRDGRPVVAITMSIGGNDYVEVGERCGGSSPSCPQVFADILARMKPELPAIYTAINDARPSGTPVFLLTYYNASDCSQAGVEESPTDIGQRVWNATITEAARPFGFVVVDLYAAFKGKACEYVEDVDPTYAGYAVIAREYEKAYEALPRSYVDPFILGN